MRRSLLEKIKARLNYVPVPINVRLALLVIFSCILIFISSVSAQETVEANLCIERYENYLRSLGNISYDFRNVVPNSEYGGTIKYNGKYAYRHVFHKTNPNFNFETVCTQEDYVQIAFNEPEEGDLTVFGYLDHSNIGDYDMSTFLGIPELCGYTASVYPPFATRYIPDLLRSFQLGFSRSRKNGADVISVSGTNGRVSIQAWFEPAQNYPLVSLEINQEGAIDGETINLTVSFDKFIDIKGVRVPTFYEYFHSMVNHKNTSGVHDSKISAAIDNVTITENSNPTPFSFRTKIPNGTKAILYDAQQIEHIWYDGKIVPRTDATMLAIARGGHKFMPGPDEPRFWFMGMGIFLILLACGKMAYSHFRKKK